MIKNNIELGDQIKLLSKSDNIELTGTVKSAINLENSISITNLFGSMAKEMQNSENKDWSMEIPILKYEIVSLKKVKGTK